MHNTLLSREITRTVYMIRPECFALDMIMTNPLLLTYLRTYLLAC